MRNHKRNHFKRHAKARATQRLGIDLHKNLHDQIVKDIQSNKYKPIRKDSTFRTIFAYDNEYNVIYDNKRKCLVTFIPKEKSIITPEGDLEEPKNHYPLNPSFPIRRLLNGD